MASGSIMTRSLSTDNTVNVIFGVIAAVLGILTLLVGWLAISRGPRRVEGRGPRDDSEYCHFSVWCDG